MKVVEDIPKILKIATFSPDTKYWTPLLKYDGIDLKVFNAPIIRLLARGLGVTFEIVLPADNEFGTKKPNGSWSGMIGMLLRGEADLTVSGFTITEERSEVVNFAHPIHVSEMTFITNKPQPLPKSWAMFNTFSYPVWISLCVCLIAISFMFYLFLRKKDTYMNILFNTLGSLLEKSLDYKAPTLSLSILMLSWFLSVTIVTSSYKAVILSALTFPTMEGIRDITDLSKVVMDKSFGCFTYNGGIRSDLWKDSSDERLQRIGECLKRNEIISHYGEIKFLKYGGRKMFITERIVISKYERDYFLSDDSFFSSHLGIAYAKNFCCPRKLDTTIHRMVAGGFYQKYLSDADFFAILKMPPPEYTQAEVKPLSLKDLSGAFLVLTIGYACAILCFISETIPKYVRK